MSEIDPVLLTSDLIKCQSVTPEEAGAIDLLEVYFEKKITRVKPTRTEQSAGKM